MKIEVSCFKCGVTVEVKKEPGKRFFCPRCREHKATDTQVYVSRIS